MSNTALLKGETKNCVHEIRTNGFGQRNSRNAPAMGSSAPTLLLRGIQRILELILNGIRCSTSVDLALGIVHYSLHSRSERVGKQPGKTSLFKTVWFSVGFGYCPSICALNPQAENFHSKLVEVRTQGMQLDGIGICGEVVSTSDAKALWQFNVHVFPGSSRSISQNACTATWTVSHFSATSEANQNGSSTRFRAGNWRSGPSPGHFPAFLPPTMAKHPRYPLHFLVNDRNQARRPEKSTTVSAAGPKRHVGSPVPRSRKPASRTW